MLGMDLESLAWWGFQHLHSLKSQWVYHAASFIHCSSLNDNSPNGKAFQTRSNQRCLWIAVEFELSGDPADEHLHFLSLNDDDSFWVGSVYSFAEPHRISVGLLTAFLPVLKTGYKLRTDFTKKPTSVIRVNSCWWSSIYTCLICQFRSHESIDHANFVFRLIIRSQLITGFLTLIRSK